MQSSFAFVYNLEKLKLNFIINKWKEKPSKKSRFKSYYHDELMLYLIKHQAIYNLIYLKFLNFKEILKRILPNIIINLSKSKSLKIFIKDFKNIKLGE